MSAREVTPKMVHAASQWLSSLHHMRSSDRLSAIEEAIRAALDAAPRVSESDESYWIANRAAIIAAIEKAGFKLMSNKNGFWLLNVQDDEPQTKEESQ